MRLLVQGKICNQFRANATTSKKHLSSQLTCKARNILDSNDPLPPGFWTTKANQRKFLEEFAKKFEINEPSQWGKIDTRTFSQYRGSTLLYNYYGGVLIKALQNIYPEWFPQTPKNFWASKLNQRRILERFANANGIQNPSDWGRVTAKQLIESGCGPLLKRQYNGAIYSMLKNVFPEIEWEHILFDKVSQGYWSLETNQRNFLEKLWKKYGIKEPKDWGKITIRQIRRDGGGTLLKYYGGSLHIALETVFKEIKWNRSWFQNIPNNPSGYWTQKPNQRKFLEQLAEVFDIRKPTDWGKLSIEQIKQSGGGALLRIHNSSLFHILKANFPTISWQRHWFRSRIQLFPKDYWENMTNQRIFLNSLSTQYDITQPTHWKRVTLGLIKKKGGRNLLKKYGNSIVSILEAVYPNENWTSLSQLNIQMQSSEPQQKLCSYLNPWFPSVSIHTNYHHSALVHKSLHSIELDVYVPAFGLAFEYQGIQHFRIIYNQDNKELADQLSRDNEKRILCERAGITLIEIPYWWDEQEESLLTTVLRSRPDLKSIIRSKLLQNSDFLKKLETGMYGIPKSMKYKDADFITLSTWWNPNDDPSHWLISEKYDGVRAYWDGRDFFLRSGQRVVAPMWVKSQLPSECLDGELWAGRLNFHVVTRSLQLNDWKFLKFVVFDAPKFPGNFKERLRFLEKTIRNSPNMILSQQIECKSKDHLLEIMEDTIANGGEGLIIRKPNAEYVVGRSSFSQKPLFVEHVEITELQQFEQRSGGKFKFSYLTVRNKYGYQFKLSVRISMIRFPLIFKGAVVTIGFNGLHTQGIPKFPILLQHHNDITWDRVLPYFMDIGSPYRKHVNCQGCGNDIHNGKLRVNVKGIVWRRELGQEPNYQIFSFCPNTSCIEAGLFHLNAEGIEHPKFDKRIGTKVSVEKEDVKDLKEIYILSEDSNYLNENFYVFKENS